MAGTHLIKSHAHLEVSYPKYSIEEGQRITQKARGKKAVYVRSQRGLTKWTTVVTSFLLMGDVGRTCFRDFGFDFVELWNIEHSCTLGMRFPSITRPHFTAFRLVRFLLFTKSCDLASTRTDWHSVASNIRIKERFWCICTLSEADSVVGSCTFRRRVICTIDQIV